jgi:probable rRNA maturation factor
VTGARRPDRAVELAGRSRFAATREHGLARWLDGVVGALAPDASSFAVRFVGDRTMRRLNRVFRGKDATTDVLSFPGAASPEGRHLGDVVVSVPQAVRQAAELGHSPGRELRLLLLHGVLHCLGHDHESDDGEMDRLERRLRRRFLPGA